MSDNTSPLPTDVESLTQLVHVLQDTVAEREAFIARLLEQIQLARHQRFGPSSEKLDDDQLRLFNEGETLADQGADEELDVDPPAIQVGGHQRRKGGRRRLPPQLPRIEEVYDLDEAERLCPHDGTRLTPAGEKISEQLDIEPAKVTVKRRIRRQYACKRCQRTVKTAPLPPQPIPRSIASAGLLAYIATSKFVDGLPLYRLNSILKRSGIDISRGTLAHWMIKLGLLVQVLVDLYHEHLLSGAYVGMDETSIQVLKEPGRAPQTKSFMWVQRGGPPDHPIVLYHYRTGRNQEVVEDLLAGFSGYLQTDGYAGYNVVTRKESVTAVGCFAHARRKFHDALKAQGNLSKAKQKKTLAYQGMRLIGKLYKIERDLKDVYANTRYQERQERSLEVLDELRTWLDAHKERTAAKTKLGEAMTYLDNQWSKLINYTKDGHLTIDNNLTENAIRPFVVGRKGWLFSDTPRGAQASANLYSLVETSKACGIDPYAYLRHVFTRLPQLLADEQPLDELLPWNIHGRLNGNA